MCVQMTSDVPIKTSIVWQHFSRIRIVHMQGAKPWRLLRTFTEPLRAFLGKHTNRCRFLGALPRFAKMSPGGKQRQPSPDIHVSTSPCSNSPAREIENMVSPPPVRMQEVGAHPAVKPHDRAKPSQTMGVVVIDKAAKAPEAGHDSVAILRRPVEAAVVVQEALEVVEADGVAAVPAARHNLA